MLKDILSNQIVIASAVGLGIIILRRISTKEKRRAAGVRHGQLISKYMGGKIGRKVWEKIEAFLQDCGLDYFGGIYEGLDKDDKDISQK